MDGAIYLDGSFGDNDTGANWAACTLYRAQFPTIGVVNLVRADQQNRKLVPHLRRTCGNNPSMSEPRASVFHGCCPLPGGNILFISPNRFPEKSLPEKCSPEAFAFSNPKRLPHS
jgi:hypothetical protein